MVQLHELPRRDVGVPALLLVGPPGSGKGTYGAMLAQSLGSVDEKATWNIETASDVLKQNDDFRKNYVEKGLLGDDDVVSGFIGSHISKKYKNKKSE